MTVADAEARIFNFYRSFFAINGPRPVPGAPGTKVAESEQIRYLWSIVEGS